MIFQNVTVESICEALEAARVMAFVESEIQRNSPVMAFFTDIECKPKRVTIDEIYNGRFLTRDEEFEEYSFVFNYPQFECTSFLKVLAFDFTPTQKKDLREFKLPVDGWAGRIGYLHLDGDEPELFVSHYFGRYKTFFCLGSYRMYDNPYLERRIKWSTAPVSLESQLSEFKKLKALGHF